MLAGAYAIDVHATAADAPEPIACGDIAGTVRVLGGGSGPPGLAIPPPETNGFGYAGIAGLEQSAERTTTVTHFLAQGLVGSTPSGPSASTPPP